MKFPSRHDVAAELRAVNAEAPWTEGRFGGQLFPLILPIYLKASP